MKSWSRSELLVMYETAWEYHYFITCCPGTDYRYIELKDGINDLIEGVRDICVNSKEEGGLKDFGRQGYWFSEGVTTLIQDPQNDKVYEAMLNRFYNLLEVRNKVM